MSAPTFGDGCEGLRGRGRTPLGDESGPEFITLPVSTISNPLSIF